MDLSSVIQTSLALITVFAMKVLGAIVVWLIARMVIARIARIVVRSLEYSFDRTVAGYIGTAVAVLLNIGLIFGILGFSASRRRASPPCWPGPGWRSA